MAPIDLWCPVSHSDTRRALWRSNANDVVVCRDIKTRRPDAAAVAMAPALTPRSIPQIFDNPNDPSYSPIVQVFDIKPLAAKTGERRFRILCSDGDHAAQGLLATSMNALVDDGRVNKFTIMRLKEYTVQEVSKKMCVWG